MMSDFCFRIFLFGISLSFFSQKILTKSLINPFVATYKKEQKFSFSKHKVHSDGIIFYQKRKILISEYGNNIGSLLKINNNKGLIKTISRNNINTKKINVKSLNNTLFNVLKGKSLYFKVKQGASIKYYFYDKNFKYAVLEKSFKTGFLKSISYQDKDDTLTTIKMSWFRFL